MSRIKDKAKTRAGREKSSPHRIRATIRGAAIKDIIPKNGTNGYSYRCMKNEPGITSLEDIFLAELTQKPDGRIGLETEL
jgi:hypothetical protein